MTCIDLRGRFGDRYRVTVDRESAEGPRDRDPWLCQIRCRRGLIYPYSATHLAVLVDGHREIARRVVALPGAVLMQDGDREKTVTFAVELFDQVAAVVRPYRRRRDRPETVARLRERAGAWNSQLK
jgi:hypothetical protein